MRHVWVQGRTEDRTEIRSQDGPLQPRPVPQEADGPTERRIPRTGPENALQMIQVYALLTDPVVHSVTRFFRPAVLPCYDTVSCSAVIAWFNVSPTENHEEETVEWRSADQEPRDLKEKPCIWRNTMRLPAKYYSELCRVVRTAVDVEAGRGARLTSDFLGERGRQEGPRLTTKLFSNAKARHYFFVLSFCFS
ncbi:unnamed protein product [Gadus morhua 'NCC']